MPTFTRDLSTLHMGTGVNAVEMCIDALYQVTVYHHLWTDVIIADQWAQCNASFLMLFVGWKSMQESWYLTEKSITTINVLHVFKTSNDRWVTEITSLVNLVYLGCLYYQSYLSCGVDFYRMQMLIYTEIEGLIRKSTGITYHATFTEC